MQDAACGYLGHSGDLHAVLVVYRPHDDGLAGRPRIDMLCGLGVGVKANGRVDLAMMEGSPDPDHPLKGFIAAIAVDCAAAFAREWRVSRLRLKKPLEALLPFYESKLGFTIVRPRNQPIYCESEV